MKSWVLIPIFCLTIPACSPKQIKHSSAESTQTGSEQFLQQESQTLLVKEQEAKLIDIPVPLNAQPIFNYFTHDSSDGMSLAYKTEQPHQEIVTLYDQEMECFGWKKAAFFDGVESLLHFEKPGRYCSVSVRPLGDQQAVTELIVLTGMR